ncbi:alkaline phosphatase family protein [Jatrophihabitans endophyticus]|uniref:alkaline phosphatase family protein n=1 Tax=Jatrophihabitans endophyticus TaxID=1206085 RepID=UPI0026EED1E4|nr:alkaline phosphatase family protein [Jatrophihabitans endophyticus]
MKVRRVVAAVLGLLALAACSGCTSTSAATPRPASVAITARPGSATPHRWRHVVVVVEENHAYGQIIGSHDATYFDHLASVGADFRRSFAETHPSQPNYVALFSGSTHGLTDDSCPHDLAGDNLGRQLLASGRSFVGWSEGLPHTGSQACTSGSYARKHVPWADFTDLPASVNRPLSAFPTRLDRLPTVSFVIPDLEHDMHDGTIAQADSWLRRHLGRYARWAPAHHSLLLVTWDEDDDTAANRIPTIAVGAGVRRGVSRQRITHYSVLRTLEDAYGLSRLGHAAHASDVHALG